MLFSIVVALMVILIAAFWAYQGFFSAVIMFFEALVAALLAFALFEQLHDLWAGSIGDGLGLPLAFMLIFMASLVSMRLMTDKLIPNNVSLPLYVDRAGGAIAGFFTGLILVGSALVAIQMLPLGSSVLGFERWQVHAKGPQQGLPFQESFFFQPDAFVVGAANMLSTGRFGGANPFVQAKCDYLQDLYAARAAPQPEARFAVPEDSLVILAYWDMPQIDHVTQRDEGGRLVREFASHPPTDGRNKFLVCRVRLDPKAAHEEKREEIRFRVPQFRLVGPRPGPAGSTAKPAVYLACGMSDIYTHKYLEWTQVQEEQPARLVRFGPQTNMILSPGATKAVAKVSSAGGGEQIEYYEFVVAFEVPDDPDFEPWYIEFKHGARAEFKRQSKEDKERARQHAEAALSALTSGGGSASSAATGGGAVGRAPAGRVQVANAVEERTGVSSALPMPLAKSDPVVSRRLRGGKLEEGHLWVTVTDETPDPDDAVTEFYVPPGKRMVQIGAEQVMAKSVYGRALSYAATIAAQIMINTADGQTYFAQGVYSLATVGDEVIFEVQYWPNAGMPERCLKKPKKLTRSIMKNAAKADRKFGYIFLVDPGVKIVGFSAGSRQKTPQRLDIDVPD